MDIKELYKVFRSSEGVNTDSRTLRSGELFFALRGENFDGNLYAEKALEGGAVAAVVNEDAPGDDPRLVRVSSPLQTLKELAAYHRENVLMDKRLPVIGLTGTNGKTTTKELIRSALSAKFRVSATEGNLNNEIGVPLSVLKISPETEIAIIEMGASHPDDLVPLLEVARPDYGLITNVGKAHLLGFGSYEGVKRAKGKLYDYIAANGGTIFLNAGDKVLAEMASERGLSPVLYGNSGYEILPVTVSEPFLRISFGDIVLRTNLVGAYNVPNVLAALKIADYFGVPKEDAMAAISAYVPSNNRSQMVKTERNIVIEDAYNANPSSMKVALSNFESIVHPRKAVCLGNMGELGEDSGAEHRALLEILSSMTLDHIFLVGEEFRKTAEDRYPCFVSSDELKEYLEKNPLSGALVLVKGSRSTRMERVLPAL